MGENIIIIEKWGDGVCSSKKKECVLKRSKIARKSHNWHIIFHEKHFKGHSQMPFTWKLLFCHNCMFGMEI
jgi:hypothetical protein